MIKQKRNLFFIMIISSMILLSIFISANAENSEIENDSLSSNEIKYILGDTNRDGKLTATDYLRIKKAFLKEYDLCGTAFAMADVDFDGIITSTDYLKIKHVFVTGTPLEQERWDKLDEKKQIQKADSPTLFPKDYFAQFIGKDAPSETSNEFSSSSEEPKNEYYEYDSYTGLYYVTTSPYDHPNELTTDFSDGKTITLKYNGFEISPSGKCRHTYSCFVSKTETEPSKMYFASLDKSGKIIGKKYYYFANVEYTDREFSSKESLLKSAIKFINDSGYSDFTLSSEEQHDKGFTFIFERKINGLKNPDYILIIYNNYGDMTDYEFSISDTADYDLRGFDSINDLEACRQVVKKKSDALLRGFQCECLSSKNPDDYIFSMEINEYFITYDGKMAASIRVFYDSIDEKTSHDHSFTIHVYI